MKKLHNQELISAGRAAEVLGCDECTVRRMIQRGELAARQCGRIWVLDAASLARAAKLPRRGRGRPRKAV